MKVTEANPPRAGLVDDIAVALPQRANALTRIFLARTGLGLSRTELGVLRAVVERPWRITELAGSEGVSQPAITLVVNRLEDRGWVRRAPDPVDRRAVLVAATEEGIAVRERLRAEYRALLHEEMATLPDDDITTLARAVEILDGLVTRISHTKTNGDLT